jgi:hypothetical protein
LSVVGGTLSSIGVDASLPILPRGDQCRESSIQKCRKSKQLQRYQRQINKCLEKEREDMRLKQNKYSACEKKMPARYEKRQFDNLRELVLKWYSVH